MTDDQFYIFRIKLESLEKRVNKLEQENKDLERALYTLAALTGQNRPLSLGDHLNSLFQA